MNGSHETEYTDIIFTVKTFLVNTTNPVKKDLKHGKELTSNTYSVMQSIHEHVI